MFNVVYLVIFALVVAIWFVAPLTMMMLFLTASAWHFGGDWRSETPWLTRPILGSALLSLPAWFHPAQVANIYALLWGADAHIIAHAQHQAAPLLAGLAGVTLLVGLARKPSAWAEAVALVASACCLQPLMFFLVYFCCLHSPRHFINECVAIAPTRVISLLGWTSAFTGLTYILAGILAWILMATDALSGALLGSVFIGLAGLTFPHMILMDTNMFRTVFAGNRQRQPDLPLGG